ncbi:hypothetical protein C0991_003515 [Blastosporella zonata]|nr:hypothetical protein C0991_003515 [Blastosporella zonata]
MSTTTQILFNSPALHSLKRDQLVKLCKIHSIKASGKNIELVEKLRKHAETLPRDSPLSIAARSEHPTEDGDETMTVQEGQNIEEAEEGSSQGTLNSLRTVSNTGGSGEFGTGMSKSSSVTSSLMSLASSSGFKRGNMPKSALASSSSFPSSSSAKSALYLSTHPGNDTLAQTSTPYSSLPETEAHLQTDHFTFDPMQGVETIHTTDAPLPLPGHSLRPGIPAPSDARLSLGLNAPLTPTRNQPTTTIRLISNPISNGSPYGRTPQLKPFKTSFELDFGSPQPNDGTRPRPQQEMGIYPPLPLDDLIPSSFNNASVPSSSSHLMNLAPLLPSSRAPASKRGAPSLLTPAPKSSTTAQLAVPEEPFVFGSPLPQHNVSNMQFKSAAASVLDEMNKRLHQDGVEGVGMDLISRLQPGAHALGTGILGPRETKEAPKANAFRQKFDELHAEEFSKMEGIDSLVKRRGLMPKADTALAAKRRKSSVRINHGVGRDRFGRRVGGETGRLSAAHVIGEKKRQRVVPGSFDDVDSDVEEEAGEGGAKPGESSAIVEDKKEGEADKATEEERAKAELEERKQKEKEAIKRKLEMNKSRRRSSAGVAGARGRVSVGRGGVVLKPQPPPKTSRFGFLSTAKSLVQKVWGGGKSAAPGPTAMPKSAPKVPKAAPAPPPVLAPAPKKAPARPSSATNPPIGSVPSLRSEKGKATATMASTTSCSRSPLPLFAPTAPTRRSLVVKTSKASSAAGPGTSVKSSTGVSSLGTRSSLASRSSSGAVSSMGSKKLLTGTGSRSSITASASGASTSSRFSSTSSRLLAPTASSLAKATRPSVSGSKSSLRNVTGAGMQIQKSPSGEGDTLEAITNSPRTPGEPWSPRTGGIFSKPLAMPSRIPTPVKKRPMTSERGISAEEQTASTDAAEMVTGVPPTRQRSLNGKKPRISRSKVIAKLASQRAAGARGLAPPGGTPGAKAGRTRSSLGVKAQRSSFGGKPISAKGDGVAMSAKKRARQSEYARRKSRVVPIDLGAGGSGSAMDIDA